MAGVNFEARGGYSDNVEFHQRIRIAALRVASAVVTEVRTLDAARPAEYWNARLALANDVIRNATGSTGTGFSDLVRRIATLIAAVFPIPGSDPNSDTDLQAVVVSTWDALAAGYRLPPALSAP